MKTSTALIFTLATMAIVLVVYTEANLILKSSHKKGKDMYVLSFNTSLILNLILSFFLRIYLGKKCEPTIIKTTGKKGKGDM